VRKTILIAVLIGFGALAIAAGGFTLAFWNGWITGPQTHVETVEAGICEHGLPLEKCPFCTPEIIETDGFCEAHGVPEALCHICRPWLVPVFKDMGDWCEEHDAPESLCPICSPGAGEKFRLGVVDIPPRPEGIIVETNEPTVVTPWRNQAPSVTCIVEKQRIRFASREIAKNIGLEIVEVRSRSLSETQSYNAQIDYDRNRFARLASRAPGIVHRVLKDIGDRVEEGETLAFVDSAELGRAKAQYLQAKALVGLLEKNHVREQRLVEKGVGPEKNALEAETRLTESRIQLSLAGQNLRNLGLNDEGIDALDEGKEASSLLPLTAPFDGVVVERAASLGEVVDTNAHLFAVGDTSKMWAMIDIYETDIHRVKTGQPAIFTIDGLRGETFGGRVTWISTRVDPNTRTLGARAELVNDEGILRANMFGKATITFKDASPGLVVPKSAIQWDGCCNLVFVRLSEVLYQPRKVRLGFEVGDFYEVEEGLEGSESVVTTGSFLLKTEIMKSSIGAGCCVYNPGSETSPPGM
jgi:cobalt-zinc-cadmium efflux system membrane fusion protein